MNTSLIVRTDRNTSCRLHGIVQLIRSWTISQVCGGYSLVSKIHYKDLTRPIGWRDNLRWWLEGKLDVVFGWAWNGSDEEIEAVYQSEVPLEYMSDRQRAVLTKPRSEYGAHCCHCAWDGWWDECDGDHDCPKCGEGIYLDELNSDSATRSRISK
jgi:hypothetical protein